MIFYEKRKVFGTIGVVLVGGLSIWGCNTGKVLLDNGVTSFDARLVSQVFTWQCGGYPTDSGMIPAYAGTYGHEVALYHAPGGLSDLMPISGCVYGADMFPIGAGANASSFEGLQGYPQWHNSSSTGELQGGFGYWYNDAMTGEHTCDAPEDILGDPVILSNALDYSGATTIASPVSPFVAFSGYDTVIEWGDPVEMSWNNHRWDRVWVHVRRSKAGDLVESLTCVVEDGNSFALTQDIWDVLDDSLVTDQTNLYVGFEKRDLQQTSSGNWIEVLTRSVSVAVVQD